MFSLVSDQRTSDSVQLALNTESYDTLDEISDGNGFKVYIHDLDTTPVTSDHFFYANAGTQYDVTIAKGLHLSDNSATCSKCSSFRCNTMLLNDVFLVFRKIKPVAHSIRHVYADRRSKIQPEVSQGLRIRTHTQQVLVHAALVDAKRRTEFERCRKLYDSETLRLCEVSYQGWVSTF